MGKSSDIAREVVWLAEHLEDDALVFRVGRVDQTNDVVAEWNALARLYASRDGSSSRFEAEPGAEPALVEKIRSGSAAMLLRHIDGKLALHGSAVMVRGGAVIMCGRSGAGKSTLAARLCAQWDASLLSDDLVPIEEEEGERWRVRPLETRHWLDAAAREAVISAPHEVRAAQDADKTPIDAPRLAFDVCALKSVVDLSFNESTPRLVRLHGIDALQVVVPQTIRFIIDEPERHRKELDRLVQLARDIPIFRLERPRDLSLLDRTCEIIAHLAESDILPKASS